MLGIGERAHCTFDVLPTTLIVERSSNRRSDERAPLTLTDPAVKSLDDLVIQAYVQTHGHTLAHSVVVLPFYAPLGSGTAAGVGPKDSSGSA